MRMAEKVEESSIVAWPKPGSTYLRAEAGCNRLGIGNATLQDTLLDELVPEAHNGFPQHRHLGEVKGQPSPAIPAGDAHSVCVVVGMNGDDLLEPRVVVRSNDQRDHAADRNPDKGNVLEIKLVEKLFDRSDEQVRVIRGLGNVRKTMPWIVQRVHRERLREERYKLFKYIELSSKRVKQDEGWAFRVIDVADGIAADYRRQDRNFWIPVKRRRRSWAPPHRLHPKREDDEENQ